MFLDVRKRYLIQCYVNGWMFICFFRGKAMEFHKRVCLFPSFRWRMFYNKVHSDTGFAHRLILKDGAVPAIKIPVMTRSCCKTTSNICVCCQSALSAHDSSAPPMAHLPGAQLFFGENRKLNLFFFLINLIKLKTLWRCEWCNTTL